MALIFTDMRTAEAPQLFIKAEGNQMRDWVAVPLAALGLYLAVSQYCNIKTALGFPTTYCTMESR